MICHEKYFAWVNVFTFLTYEEILQNKANAKCRTNGLQNKKQAGVVMMESSTKETFAKPGYIKTHFIFVEHSLNKKGFSFSISVEQTQTVNNKQKTKLYDWNFLRFAENIFFFASVFGTFFGCTSCSCGVVSGMIYLSVVLFPDKIPHYSKQQTY